MAAHRRRRPRASCASAASAHWRSVTPGGALADGTGFRSTAIAASFRWCVHERRPLLGIMKMDDMSRTTTPIRDQHPAQRAVSAYRLRSIENACRRGCGVRSNAAGRQTRFAIPMHACRLSQRPARGKPEARQRCCGSGLSRPPRQSPQPPRPAWRRQRACAPHRGGFGFDDVEPFVESSARQQPRRVTGRRAQTLQRLRQHLPHNGFGSIRRQVFSPSRETQPLQHRQQKQQTAKSGAGQLHIRGRYRVVQSCFRLPVCYRAVMLRLAGGGRMPARRSLCIGTSLHGRDWRGAPSGCQFDIRPHQPAPATMKAAPCSRWRR